MTTVLLVGAGLLTRAIGHAAALEPGFAIKDVQVVSVKPEILPRRWSTRGKAFFLGLRDALRNTDVGPVAVADEPPFWQINLVMVARRPESPDTIQRILMRRVSRNYFGVLGIPIVKGRIPDSDVESRELVVNEAAARALWAGADPIGRTLESAMSRTEFWAYRVVGIAKDVPVRSMSEIEPVIYRTPDWWPTDGTATLFVRGSPPGVGQRVRAVAASLEPQVTVTERPLVDYVRDSLTTAALASRVAWAIGALGLVLAMVGAFGVFAQAAEARRREIGIRHGARLFPGTDCQTRASNREQGARVGTCRGLSALADERADPAAFSLRTQPLRSRRLCWRGRHPDARWRRGDMDPGPPGHGCRSRDHTSLRVR